MLVDLLHGFCMILSSPCFWAIIGSMLWFVSGPLQVVSPSWVVAIIGEEGGDSRSLRCLVVSCKLRKRHALCPIILKVINIGPQVLLHYGIEFLCLPICLRVEYRREPQILSRIVIVLVVVNFHPRTGVVYLPPCQYYLDVSAPHP